MAKTETRASGLTAAEEVTREVSEEADKTVDPEVLPEERKRTFRTPGFSRMQLDWQGDDRDVVQRARDAVEGRIQEQFVDAFQVMYQVYDAVRTPEVDPETGEKKVDRWGLTIWKRTPSGDYEEDWSRLTRQERENLLFIITTRLWDWEQRSADAWGEAMMAKAKWEERFAIEYDKPSAGTMDDRRARGNIGATEERYFAIFVTWYSKRAEAVVNTMGLVGQRLKDSLAFG